MQKQKISIIIANTLDHFDSNLYGFIAPIMAPLFFPKQEPIVQLILAYSFLATSSITRPLGVIICDWLASTYSPLNILIMTLLGVGICTVATGFLPTFEIVGYFAPLLLLLIRFLMGIFAAGEKSIAGLYLIEGQKSKHAVVTNAWFESTVILGCALASWVAMYVSKDNWRLPFFLGGVLAFYALSLRYKNFSVNVGAYQNVPIKGGLKFSRILLLIFSGGLSYVTYDMSFILMNTFVPMITKISFHTMMGWNTALLVFDMLLFIPIGYVIRKLDLQVSFIKKSSALMLGLPAIVLFHFMQDTSLFYVLMVRFWIVMWGIVFSCVMQVHLAELFPYRRKYLWIGLGTMIGSTLIGRSTSAICLWGFYKTNLAVIPGVYLSVVSLMVWILCSKRLNA